MHKARYGKRLAEFKDNGTGRGYGHSGGKKVFFGTCLGVGLGVLLDYVLDETGKLAFIVQRNVIELL